MEFSQIFEIFGKFQNKYFNNEEYLLINKIIEKLFKNIQDLMENKQIEIESNISDEISNIYNIIERIIFEDPIDNHFIEFIDAFNFLIYNWNMNLLNNEKLNFNTKKFAHIIAMYRNFVNGIEIFEKINHQLEFLSRWNPPSIDLVKTNILPELTGEICQN